jgi:ferritin
VTENNNLLMNKAVELGDFATQSFLQWFVTEQVEEEDLVRHILQKLRLIGDSGTALYMLNEELKARKAEPAAGGKGEAGA